MMLLRMARVCTAGLSVVSAQGSMVQASQVSQSSSRFDGTDVDP